MRYDQIENPVDGRFVDVGVRSRWVNSKTNHALDLEIIDTYAVESPFGDDDVWLPLETRGSWLTEVFDMGFAVSHDGRYDLETGLTS
ncbi:MAG: hypothetical protein JRH11_28685, partial [Deltaproteobacteria bacterium]|nr:hypothetical protein [Deltaproteobacteria bacterium]